MSEELEPFAWTVDRADVMRIADILRDPNPIHFDEAAATAVGLPGPINQGPANLAYAINMLQANFPGARIASIQSRYLANVMLGDTVRAEGRVTETAGPVVTCEFRVLNAAGRDAVVGSAVLHLVEQGA